MSKIGFHSDGSLPTTKDNESFTVQKQTSSIIGCSCRRALILESTIKTPLILKFMICKKKKGLPMQAEPSTLLNVQYSKLERIMLKSTESHSKV